MALPKRSAWQELHGIADRRTSAFRRAFLDAVLRAEQAVGRGALLESALRRGDTETAYRLAVVAWERQVPLLRAQVAAALRRTFDDAGIATVAQIVKAGPVSMAMRFDVTNPAAIAWVQEHVGELVTRISDDMRGAIRAIVERSVSGEFDIRRSAQLIRQTGIGLTERQAMAVINYRLSLLESGASPSMVSQLGAKYRARLIQERAATIARTETINAVNAGQLNAWRQGQANGVLDHGMLKQWIITPDDRLCPLCRVMNGQTRPLDQPFLNPISGRTVMAPTLHPRCRCAIGLVSGGSMRRAIA